ncbi:hypothetical protein V8E36_002723 [Tilletia maclaganii]
MANGSNVKWPTHLMVTADLVLSEATSTDFNHKVQATMIDSNDQGHEANLHFWSRLPPHNGAIIMNQVTCATAPLRFYAEGHQLRPIPAEIDGTDPDMPTIPSSASYANGLVYVSKALGYIQFEVEADFEDSPKYERWLFPKAGSLVAFDAVIHSITEKGTIAAHIRRLVTLDHSSNALATALGMSSNGSTTSRAALILEARAKAGKVTGTSNLAGTNGGKTSATSASPVPEASKVGDSDSGNELAGVVPTTGAKRSIDAMTTETPTKISPDAVSAPPAPKATRSGSTMEDPSSPSPAQGSGSKRVRKT